MVWYGMLYLWSSCIRYQLSGIRYQASGIRHQVSGMVIPPTFESVLAFAPAVGTGTAGTAGMLGMLGTNQSAGLDRLPRHETQSSAFNRLVC